MGNDQARLLPDKDASEIDFGILYRNISETYGFGPDVIGEMTSALFLIYLKQDQGLKVDQSEAQQRALLARERRLEKERYQHISRKAWLLPKQLQ